MLLVTALNLWNGQATAIGEVLDYAVSSRPTLSSESQISVLIPRSARVKPHFMLVYLFHTAQSRGGGPPTSRFLRVATQYNIDLDGPSSSTPKADARYDLHFCPVIVNLSRGALFLWGPFRGMHPSKFATYP